jgi:hypothetical protein
MPITIDYTDDKTGVTFFAVDKVTGKDIIASMKELFQSENFVNLKYWIVDRSRCTKYEVDSEEVREIAYLDKDAAKRNPQLLHALIADTDLQYGMSRMYEIHSDDGGFRTKIFRDRAAAEEWIQKELKTS